MTAKSNDQIIKVVGSNQSIEELLNLITKHPYKHELIIAALDLLGNLAATPYPEIVKAMLSHNLLDRMYSLLNQPDNSLIMRTLYTLSNIANDS